MTNSKQKGKRGELELVKRLKDILPGKPWRRSQQFCGANGDADVVGVKDLHIECKRVEAGTASSAQAKASGDTARPMAQLAWSFAQRG